LFRNTSGSTHGPDEDQRRLLRLTRLRLFGFIFIMYAAASAVIATTDPPMT
jgi:hypothetical protein